jgi:hypothetical protein
VIVLSSGEKACIRCFKRPAMMRVRRAGRVVRRVPGSYCRECKNEYSRQWRAGTVERRLTLAEWDVLSFLREEFGPDWFDRVQVTPAPIGKRRAS